MMCPQCSKADDVSRIDTEGKFHFCLKCNYTWAISEKGTKKENKKSDMSFRGLPVAQQFLQNLCKIERLPPEIKASMEAQLTTLLMEQWVDGMRAGQVASIVHAMDHYRKKEPVVEDTPEPKDYQTVVKVPTKVIRKGVGITEEEYETSLEKLAELLYHIGEGKVDRATLDLDNKRMSLEGPI